MMRRLILLASLVALSAEGGEVYKCKGPTGEITFTNIKCPEHTATEHYATYQPEEEAPPLAPAPPEVPPPPVAASNVPLTVQPPVQPGARQEAQTPVQPSAFPAAQPFIPSAAQPIVQESAPQPIQPVAQLPAQPEPSTTGAPTTVGSGYKCSDGENVWLQSTPCAPIGAHVASKPIERAATDATQVGATAEVKRTAPVQERAPSQGVLCDQLISQTSRPEHQNGGPGADELNKLLVANGCKR
jgi:hypothetical protein